MEHMIKFWSILTDDSFVNLWWNFLHFLHLLLHLFPLLLNVSRGRQRDCTAFSTSRKMYMSLPERKNPQVGWYPHTDPNMMQLMMGGKKKEGKGFALLGLAHQENHFQSCRRLRLLKHLYVMNEVKQPPGKRVCDELEASEVQTLLFTVCFSSP